VTELVIRFAAAPAARCGILLGMRTLPIIVGVALGLGLGSCTEEYCSDNLAVPGFALYVHETPAYADGVYRWTVTADGVTRVRDVTIAGGVGHCACGPGGDPAGAARVGGDLNVTMAPGDSELTLMDDPRGERQAGPAHVEVAITRGGVEMASFVFDPVYLPVQGNCQTVMRSTYRVDVVGP
jgi:hypothetical protein